ncbi:hypothetical protein FA346_09785 [Pseudomonas aeruginosa]|uniref:hypothetical protein n=1 Tax=Pseudomonas aeruginosa TaxID=287 RepID=UPI003458A1E7|nr:hypothetical protein [Pseudomonas aeruginosa]HBP1970704.1 hypothetical protein [Pseudomonas aeruginosa]
MIDKKAAAAAARFMHLRLWSIDFDSAYWTLKAVERAPDESVAMALVRDSVVTYCRPFTTSSHKQKLDSKEVPMEYRSLHIELWELRNKQFAHTDLDLHLPKAMWLGRGNSATLITSCKSFDHQQLLPRREGIERLFLAMRNKVDQLCAKTQQYLESIGILERPV